jgi:hypothetical protein
MYSLPAILLAAVFLCVTPLTAIAAAADIVFASGSARIIAVDQSVRAASKGMPVALGETVDTGGGMAQLRFRDGGTISLRPGTQFKVEQFRFTGKEGKASADDRMVTRLIKGTLRALSGLIGKERHEQYEMKTSVGTIGIRGTEFGATLDEQGLRVTTHAGLVEVCNDVGCEFVAPGQSLIVRDAGSRPTRDFGAPAQVPGAGPEAPALPQPQSLPDMPQQPMPNAPQPTHDPYTGGAPTAMPYDH